MPLDANLNGLMIDDLVVGRRPLRSTDLIKDLAATLQDDTQAPVPFFSVAPVSAAVLQACAIPTPYPTVGAAVVHPSVVYDAQGWRGYRYWMAYTPYPSADSTYENPCVAASDDGLNWVVPGGAINPIVAKPAKLTAYNADTHLVLSPARDRLYLVFRERGVAASNNLKICESPNGINWTAPVTVKTGVQGSEDFASPSIWWNGTNWVCLSHQLDTTSPWPVRRMVTSGSDIYSGWSAPTTVTVSPPSGRAWWHSCVVRLASGQLVGVAQDNAGTAGSSGNLYWWSSSDDGVSFQIRPCLLTGGWYRSALIVEPAPDGGLVRLYAGALGTGVISSARLPFNRGALRRVAIAVRQSILSAAASPVAGVLWADTCVRADSAIAAGTATSGGTYTASTGTMGIAGNRIYTVTTGNNRIYASMGAAKSDYSAEVVFDTIGSGSQAWFIVRLQDANNFWRVGKDATDGFLKVQKIVAGSIAYTQTLTKNFASGMRVRVDCIGPYLSVFQNDDLVGVVSDAAFYDQINVGLQGSGANPSYWKQLVVVDLA